MAKQLYDYWFVQFDFPNEEGKPYKSSGGKMVWNETLKREIPEGWVCISLDRLGSFKNGINYSKDEIGDKDYKIVNVRNISSSSLFLDYNELDDINLISESADNYIVGGNDILLARSGTPGATRVLQSMPKKDVLFCGFIICYTVESVVTKIYLTYQLKSLEQITKGQSGGSILSNISQEILKRIYVPVPDNETLARFNSMIYPIWNRIDNGIKEISMLKLKRDALLPLLMNGQVTINQ